MYQYRLMNTDDLELLVDYQKRKRMLEPDVFPDFDEHKFRENFVKYPIEEAKNNWVILVLHDDQLIGRVDLIIDFSFMDYESVGYIDWVYVMKNHRGKGIAKELFRRAEKIFLDNGVDFFHLVQASNEQAVKFYESTDLVEQTITRRKKDLRG